MIWNKCFAEQMLLGRNGKIYKEVPPEKINFGTKGLRDKW